MKTNHFCHGTAIVETPNIGEGTRIWQYVVIQKDVSIGRNCNICFSVFIENEVKIGDNVTIKNHVSIWRGITIESDVFIGSGVIFTNDKHPISGVRDKPIMPTIIKRRSSLGSGCIILPGVTVGQGSTIAAGSIVSRDVAPGECYIAPKVSRGR